jgi:colanic acid biosynthesis glycosyl transferase WcaI
MGRKQDLPTALATANLGAAKNIFKLTLVGEGSDKALLERKIAEDRINNVRLLPLQRADLLPEMLAAADALLLIQRADIVDSVAPSKLLTYMAAGRPIVAAVHDGSEAARLVREAGCGVVTPPENPEALLSTISLLSKDSEQLKRLGRSGKNFADRNFAKRNVLAFWDQLLQETTVHPTRRSTSGRS